jgi:hypothetical protein
MRIAFTTIKTFPSFNISILFSYGLIRQVECGKEVESFKGYVHDLGKSILC